NMGFAIPIDLASQVAGQIRKAGHVARGYLGVSAEDFTAERAAEMHVPFTPGALVNVVTRGSPAAAAGLASNDVVVELGGHPIDGQRRLSSVVALSGPGERAKLVYLRQGRRIETSVTLTGPRGGGEASVLGVELRPLEAHEASALGLPGGPAPTPRAPRAGAARRRARSPRRRRAARSTSPRSRSAGPAADRPAWPARPGPRAPPPTTGAAARRSDGRQARPPRRSTPGRRPRPASPASPR